MTRVDLKWSESSSGKTGRKGNAIVSVCTDNARVLPIYSMQHPLDTTVFSSSRAQTVFLHEYHLSQGEHPLMLVRTLYYFIYFDIFSITFI